MSRAHLRELEIALNRRGWRIVATFPGNGYDICATWEIRRGGEQRSRYLRFEWPDLDTDCGPIEESYGCFAEPRRAEGLYFRRVNRSRHLWETDLESFVRSLDEEG